MHFKLFQIITIISNVAAFAPGTLQSQRSHRQSSDLRMSTEESLRYVITGNNFELTPAINDYVNKKLDKVMGKLSSNDAVTDCDVHLSVIKNPKVKNGHKAEVVTAVKGTVIRCAEETADMYSSIDLVTDRLARKLRKYKERRLDGFHGGPNMGENLASVLESLSEDIDSDEPAEEEYVDPEAPTVTKVKSYDLSTPISIEEAIFALDYVDHDFYVFRDAATNEINVVYKRNAGGYGLIEPSQ